MLEALRVLDTQKELSLQELVKLKNNSNEALSKSASDLINFLSDHENDADSYESNADYQRLVAAENANGKIWSETLEAIFDFVPRTNYEYGLKISTLVADIASGLENPKYLEHIMTDANSLMQSE